MIDKRVASIAEALSGLRDGAVLLIGGFGAVGQPDALINGVCEIEARDLTLVANNAGWSEVTGIPRLLQSGKVRRMICSYPKASPVFEELYRAGKIELELVPQGTLAERIRAAGAGIPGFYTPTSVGTRLAEGKETKEFDGKTYVLETALKADAALLEAWRADRFGNLTYRGSGRNFNPIMAMATPLSIVQAHEIVDIGGIDPNDVVTPGIFVKRVVQAPAQPAPKS